jgi:hypothetical protein
MTIKSALNLRKSKFLSIQFTRAVGRRKFLWTLSHSQFSLKMPSDRLMIERVVLSAVMIGGLTYCVYEVSRAHRGQFFLQVKFTFPSSPIATAKW